MQLVDPLVEDFVSLLAGELEHFDAEPPGYRVSSTKRLPPASTMMPPDRATSGATARFPGPMYAGYGWNAPYFRRRADRQTHLDAVAGAAMVAWKRNVHRFGNVPGQQLRARAEPARGENNFSRCEHAIFCRRARSAPPVSCWSDNTGVENRTSIFFSRSTASKRKSVMVLSAFHECDGCAQCPKANSPI